MENSITRGPRHTHPLLAVVVLFVAVLAPATPVAVVAFIAGLDAEPMTLTAQVVLLVAPFGLTLLLLWAWVRLFENRSFTTLGFTTPPMRALPGAVAGAGLFGLVVLVAALAGQVQVGSWNPAMIGGAVVGLLAFAVQGSTEEILCRGFLLQAIRARWGLPIAVAGQAVVFAALHLANPGGARLLPVLNLVLFGVFLAGWTLLEGGLWGACAWHVAWNWTQGNVLGAAVSGQPLGVTVLQTAPTPGASDLLAGGPFGLEGSVLTTVVLAVGAAVVLLLYARRVNPASAPPPAGT